MTTAARFEPEVSNLEAYCDVLIAGEIDAANAEHYEEAIASAVENSQLNAVLVDMSSVQFLGAAGLNALVKGFHLARTRGKRLVLVNVSTEAQRSLQLARLDDAFPIRAYLA